MEASVHLECSIGGLGQLTEEVELLLLDAAHVGNMHGPALSALHVDGALLCAPVAVPVSHRAWGGGSQCSGRR